MRTTRIIPTALIILAAVAGCGGPDVTADEAPAPVATVAQGQPSEAPDETGDAAEAVRAVVDAIARFDSPSDMREGLPYTEEGSTAYVYLVHRAHLADAFLDGGSPAPEFDVSEVGDGFELCQPAYSDDCGTFADFKANDGKVTEFTVDGEKVGSLLTIGNGDTVSAGGVTAEFLTAYNNVEGLWVTIRVAAGSEPVEVDIYGATYRAPDGAQRQTTDSYGPFELGAESTATAAVVFADVEPGGTVTLTAWDSDFNEISLEIKVG